MADRISAPGLRKKKAAGEKIVCLTAYDVTTGLLAERAGVEVVLVGDSLGNVVLGFETTLPVELSDMVRATQAVASVVSNGLVVADLPFGSYQASTEDAVRSAVALMKAGAGAVKLEGPYFDAVRAIVQAGIPVMGHVGFTPQSVHGFGGFKVQGRTDGDAISDMAAGLEEAGVFAVVLELIPADLSKVISERLTIPTIGIGGGVHCDGQIQVIHDILGLTDKAHRHAKRYVEGFDVLLGGVKQYVDEVRLQSFPTDENSF